MSEKIGSDNSKINAKLLEQNEKLVDMVNKLLPYASAYAQQISGVTAIDEAFTLLEEITNG